MTLEQEFQKQWVSLCNYIKSEILKFNVGTIELNRIQSILDSEKKKWFLPGQYNNAWFEKLKRSNPEVAQEFEDTLKNIRIVPVNVKQSNYQLEFGIIAVIGAAVGLGVSRIFMATIIPSLLWTAGGTVVGLLIGNAICSQKKNDVLNEICSVYEEQLKKAEETLSQIVSRSS